MKSSKKAGSAFDKEPEKEAVVEVASEKVSKKSYSKKKILVWVLVTVIALAGIGSGAYYYLQYQSTQKLLKDPVLGTEMEVERLVEKIAKVVELPQEVPTIATVSDASKLKDQQFFKKAQNGDKVLIYQNAKKAILYRPSTGKIVEFGPINLGSTEQGSASASPAAAPTPVRVALYNGTGVTGLAASTERALNDKDYTVVLAGNASKRDYDKTFVVDLKGDFGNQAQKLASELKGEVMGLPEGEKKPDNADLLVILGAN
jgi:hypothetical protein